jgi:hypothetical protein
MRTAAAYISKIKREVLGKTYKVQDTNHRLFTTTLYRGAIGCGPVDYTQLNYVEPCLCDYIGPAKNPPIAGPPPKPCRDTIDGGTSVASGVPIIDGGNASRPGSQIIDGGTPGVCARIFDGGKSLKSGVYVVDGGRSRSSGTFLVDGGNTQAICTHVVEGGTSKSSGISTLDGGNRAASGDYIQDGGTVASGIFIVDSIQRLKIGNYEVKRCI